MAAIKPDEDGMVIEPSSAAKPAINTSDWPLLLKNWDQRMSDYNTRDEEQRLMQKP